MRDGNLLPAPFLDIAARVSSGGERGLFSMAFDPDYDDTGISGSITRTRMGTRAWSVSVSRRPRCRGCRHRRCWCSRLISRIPTTTAARSHSVPMACSTSAWATAAAPATPTTTHRPLDPPGRTAAHRCADHAVRDPARQPVRGVDLRARPEIWAYGLRNPWRFSFDAVAGDLYIADVGQNQWEEINVVSADDAPVNYGWPIMEGYTLLRCERLRPHGPCSARARVHARGRLLGDRRPSSTAVLPCQASQGLFLFRLTVRRLSAQLPSERRRSCGASGMGRRGAGPGPVVR
jgi:hypothetical protein